MSDRTLLSLMLWAGLCSCLAMALLLRAGKGCRVLFRLRQWNRLPNGGGWRWSRRNRIPPALNAHGAEQSDQESRTGDDGNPKAQEIASPFIQERVHGFGLSVAAKNGAILAGLWPCFRWQQPLPAFPRAAGRTSRSQGYLRVSTRALLSDTYRNLRSLITQGSLVQIQPPRPSEFAIDSV
jgi:hypothetical protein